MINELIAYSKRQREIQINNWLIKNGLNNSNFHKFKIKVKPSTDKDVYYLYPARGRNAKKHIDIFIYQFTIN